MLYREVAEYVHYHTVKTPPFPVAAWQLWEIHTCNLPLCYDLSSGRLRSWFYNPGIECFWRSWQKGTWVGCHGRSAALLIRSSDECTKRHGHGSRQAWYHWSNWGAIQLQSCAPLAPWREKLYSHVKCNFKKTLTCFKWWTSNDPSSCTKAKKIIHSNCSDEIH